MCGLFTSLFDLPDHRGEPEAASYEALIESHDKLQAKAIEIIADQVADGADSEDINSYSMTEENEDYDT